MPLKPLPTAAGAGVAVAADQIWRRTTGLQPDTFFFEHEHLGLISLIAGQVYKPLESFATGLGTGLIVVKAATYPDPLSLSEGASEMQLNLALDALLGGVLAMAYFAKK